MSELNSYDLAKAGHNAPSQWRDADTHRADHMRIADDNAGLRHRIAALEAENAALRAAVENCKGLFDTPVERRRRQGDEYYAEAMQQLRAVIDAVRKDSE